MFTDDAALDPGTRTYYAMIRAARSAFEAKLPEVIADQLARADALERGVIPAWSSWGTWLRCDECSGRGKRCRSCQRAYGAWRAECRRVAASIREDPKRHAWWSRQSYGYVEPAPPLFVGSEGSSYNAPAVVGLGLAAVAAPPPLPPAAPVASGAGSSAVGEGLEPGLGAVGCPFAALTERESLGELRSVTSGVGQAHGLHEEDTPVAVVVFSAAEWAVRWAKGEHDEVARRQERSFPRRDRDVHDLRSAVVEALWAKACREADVSRRYPARWMRKVARGAMVRHDGKLDRGVPALRLVPLDDHVEHVEGQVEVERDEVAVLRELAVEHPELALVEWGFKMTAFADGLGLTHSAVRARVHRSRQRLQTEPVAS